MFYNKFSRRYFLKGAGASLMLPFLPSIMSRAYAAGTPPVRYIQFLSAHGQFGAQFYPSDDGLAQTASGIFARPLSGINGDISTVFGSQFTPFKNKISLVRGTHVLAGSSLHNGSMPTCASGTPEDNTNNGRPVFPYSIDDVLSASSKIYPDPTGKQRLVNFCPAPESYTNFSWTKKNGAVQHPDGTTETSALLAKFIQLTQPQAPAQDPAVVRQTNVLSSVFEDYKAVRDSGKLSSEDKLKFESYIALISEVDTNLKATPSILVCNNPTQEADVSAAAKHRNQARILVAALACQLTNVASYVLSTTYDPSHDYAHQNKFLELSAVHKASGLHLAYFMSLMDQIQESNGTLLDNSLIYWGNEYGELLPYAQHCNENMAVMIAGGAAGKLQLGQYIDYRKSGNRPLNNLLVTFFNAMGLSSADYERDGIIGFGEYNNETLVKLNQQAFTATPAERRKVLPYLFKGTGLG